MDLNFSHSHCGFFLRWILSGNIFRRWLTSVVHGMHFCFLAMLFCMGCFFVAFGNIVLWIWSTVFFIYFFYDAVERF